MKLTKNENILAIALNQNTDLPIKILMFNFFSSFTKKKKFYSYATN